MRRLESKVILVAGGGSIGGELARRYAGEGASVVLGDVNLDAARAVTSEIEREGGKAIAALLDGADEASNNAAVALACDTYGGLDGLHVNFATFVGADDGSDVLGIPLAAYDEAMRVNARGYLVSTRAALPPILARGGGSIVYTSSIGAYIGEVGRLGYAMSKSALNALMRHVAARYGPQGVRANCIAPGIIRNARWTDEMLKHLEPHAQVRHIKRNGETADVAAMGALLMSDDGSFVTGQVIAVVGGETTRP